MVNGINIKIDDVTCLDGAEVWIDKNAEDYVVLSGFSKMVSVEVAGKLQKEEQVIVDFSNLKYALKYYIDEYNNGFDHKLFISNDLFESDNVEIQVKGSNGAKRDGLRILKPNGEVAFQVEGRKFLRVYGDDTRHSLEEFMSDYLTDCLQNHYGEKYLKAWVTLHSKPVHAHDGDYRATFQYMHGLCKSSSYGCQNIVHGHSSFVQVFNKNGDVDEFASNMIAQYLDGCYIYNDAHAKTSNGKLLKIGYKSLERGKWKLYIPPSYSLPICAEPTIENIIDHVCIVFEDELKAAYASEVVISEGLSKMGIGYVD